MVSLGIAESIENVPKMLQIIFVVFLQKGGGRGGLQSNLHSLNPPLICHGVAKAVVWLL